MDVDVAVWAKREVIAVKKAMQLSKYFIIITDE
jgi:hypothetical protein